MSTRLLVLLPDGAAGVLSDGSDRAPATASLPHGGALTTVPAGLPVASEVAIPALLGVRLDAAPARGPVEAAALRVALGPDQAAWRLDLPDGALPAGGADVEVLAKELAAVLRAEVRHLRRGRFVVVGPQRWLADGRDGSRLAATTAALGVDVRIWGGGPAVSWRALPHATAVVAAGSGAAAGVAHLLGADLVAPRGATGFPGTDLAAKTAAAARLLADGRHEVVLVHVGAPDEAGHARDATTQRGSVAAFDREVVAPLLRIARDLRVPVLVAPDHGTDPATGAHTAGPVPARASFPLPASGVAWELVRNVLVREVAA